MTRAADILVVVGLAFIAWYQINAGLQIVFASFVNFFGVDLRTWVPVAPVGGGTRRTRTGYPSGHEGRQVVEMMRRQWAHSRRHYRRTPQGFPRRPLDGVAVRLVEGRMFRPGTHEIVVGRMATT